ncbi:MAG: protein translocase subunit SecF [Anaerolineae bacterium]|jgi:preprotein translocase SecF subunit|nr:protein translocase subunit SecF [Anaerolineae bacterium]
MFNLVEKRRWFFLISAALLIPSLLAMIYSTATTGAPFRLSIDFVGGSIYDLAFVEPGITEADLRGVFGEYDDREVTVQRLTLADGSERWSVRGSFLENAVTERLLDALDAISPVDRERTQIEQVSETIGAEVARAAFFAVLAASVIVSFFIIIAFRTVPRALRYGLSAIAAMVHDVLIVMGIASVMGLFFGWEVDALFLTAVLTILAYSVQDSVVLFDRIRENIPIHLGEPYETIVNRSIWETIHRSLATQLNAFFVMAAILLFGGETVKQFIAILFVGLLAGTYSSIFVAVPLLVSWEKGEIPVLSRIGELLPPPPPTEDEGP